MHPATLGFVMGVALVVFAPVLSGFAESATLLVPEEYPDIRTALAAAVDGDMVSVLAGEYGGAGNTRLAVSAKSVSIAGRGGRARITCVGSWDQGFIDLDVGGGKSCRLADLEVTGGGDYEGMILATGHGSVALERVLVEWTGSEYASIPVAARNGVTLVVDGCELRYNAGDAAAILVDGGSECEVRSCQVHMNMATIGVIASANSEISIRDSHICDNSGGVYINSAVAEVWNSVITGNVGQYYGGIYCYVGTVALHGTTVAWNAGSEFGGVMVGFGVATVDGCIVYGNCDSGGSTRNLTVAQYGACIVDCSCLPGSTVDGNGRIELRDGVIDADPLFCDQAPCVPQYWGLGDPGLNYASPCLPNGNSCGIRMGANTGVCGEPVPTRRGTWGSIKERFRR